MFTTALILYVVVGALFLLITARSECLAHGEVSVGDFFLLFLLCFLFWPVGVVFFLVHYIETEVRYWEIWDKPLISCEKNR